MRRYFWCMKQYNRWSNLIYFEKNMTIEKERYDNWKILMFETIECLLLILTCHVLGTKQFTLVLVHRTTLEPPPCQNYRNVEKSNSSYGTVRTPPYTNKQSRANQGTCGCGAHSKPIHSNTSKKVGSRGPRVQIGQRFECFSLIWRARARAMRITDPKSLVFHIVHCLVPAFSCPFLSPTRAFNKRKNKKKSPRQILG